jgi:hypothetical protein
MVFAAAPKRLAEYLEYLERWSELRVTPKPGGPRRSGWAGKPRKIVA